MFKNLYFDLFVLKVKMLKEENIMRNKNFAILVLDKE